MLKTISILNFLFCGKEMNKLKLCHIGKNIQTQETTLEI